MKTFGFGDPSVPIEERREQTYIANRAEGMPPAKAAEAAGYTGRKKRQPQRLIEGPELRQRVQRALAKHGGGIDKITETLVKAMDAKTQASFQGEVTESEHADHKVRVQAARTAAELMGITERVPAGGTVNTVILNISGGMAEALAAKMGAVIEGK